MICELRYVIGMLVSVGVLSASTNKVNRPNEMNCGRKRAIIELIGNLYLTNDGLQHIEFKILKD